LNSFFGYLCNEGKIVGNPISRIESIKVPYRKKYAYSSEDLEAMRSKCGHLRDRALLEFLLATGLRVSEVSSLTVSQVDFVKQNFNVVGKGNKERKAYISDVAMYHLQKYLQWRMQHEEITWEELLLKPLFAKINAPYTVLENNGIRTVLKKIGMAANVDHVHPHRFRRTFASEASHRQIPLEDLKELMGHTKMDTTLLYIDNDRDIEASYRKFVS
jgi:site-specific recombinase XerD